MSLFLTVIGLLLLFVALAGVSLGVYMATDPTTRDSGGLFALWWVSGVAAGGGVLMKDGVTSTIGALCFLVAGAVYAFDGGSASRTPVRRGDGSPDGPRETTRPSSEETTRENDIGDYGRAAS